MKNISQKMKGLWAYALKHKVISTIALIVVVIIIYQIIKTLNTTPAQTLYTVSQATKGTIVTSVSGTGQVSASDQLDLKIKASGDLTYLNAKVGQKVTTGALIAQVDTTDAAYTLEDAKLAYDKLVTVDPTTLQKNQNSVTQAQTSLDNSYTSARTSLVSNLSDMSNLSDGLTTLFDFNTGYLTSGNYSSSDTAKGYQSKAELSWNNFSNLLTNLTAEYKNLPANPSDANIESVVSDFYQTALAGSQASKDAQDAVIYLKNNDTSNRNTNKADAAYTSVVSLVSTANSVVSNLSSAENSISNNKISLQNSNADLNTLVTGPDTLSLRQAQLTVNQAQTALDDCSAIAPFDGVIASVPVNKGDTLSGGTVVATLITTQEIAKISLNEIDAANVKVGQKATVTFDAVPDLTITGTVTNVDLIGTVSQGVVSYNVQITFDVNDARVKPGMSVSAAIITQVKTDVLTVPNGAIKAQGSSNYVEVFKTAPAGSEGGQAVPSSILPDQQTVTIGISNDTMTEILTGLTEGQTIVTKTTTGTATQTTKTTTSLSSLLGGNRTGGAATTRAATGGGGGFTRPAGN